MVYFDNNLNLYCIKLVGVDEFYIKYVGKLLILLIGKEVLDFFKLVCYEFIIKDKMDIVYLGFGWICVKLEVENLVVVVVWVLEGVVVVLCKVLI